MMKSPAARHLWTSRISRPSSSVSVQGALKVMMGRAGKPPASVQLTSWEAMDALFGQRPGRVHRWDREGGGGQKVAERPTVMVTEGCDGVRALGFLHTPSIPRAT